MRNYAALNDSKKFSNSSKNEDKNTRNAKKRSLNRKIASEKRLNQVITRLVLRRSMNHSTTPRNYIEFFWKIFLLTFDLISHKT